MDPTATDEFRQFMREERDHEARLDELRDREEQAFAQALADPDGIAATERYLEREWRQ